MTVKPTIGHNSDGIAPGQLRALVERIERLDEDKKALSEDIKEVFAEAKGNGFDPKIIRKLISIRAQDPGKRAEEEAVLELYRTALASA